MKASELISDGAELLLLTRYSKLVGSVVLPIVGAVPDAMIVLFSGVGHNFHEKIAVGVGDLAGSTIMLLTVPWFCAVVAGRVDVDNAGNGTYHGRRKLSKKQPCWGLTSTGVNPLRSVKVGGVLIAITSLPYLLVQAAAFSAPFRG